jgi:hypothetical protein
MVWNCRSTGLSGMVKTRGKDDGAWISNLALVGDSVKVKSALLLSIASAAASAAIMLALISHFIGPSDGELGPLLKGSGELTYKPNLRRNSRPTLTSN